MATQVLQSLITTTDGFVAIRRQILAILVAERDNQMTLATAAGQDPQMWNFKAYEERSKVFEEAISQQQTGTPLPIVNVWFDSDSFDKRSATVAETQDATANYNIDIFGFGLASNTANGHMPADLVAANNCQRISTQVRNMLMASHNTYLQLPRGVARDRRLQSRQEFQPRLDQNPDIEILAMRMRFEVRFNETSPQYQGQPLSELAISIIRSSTGEILQDLTLHT